MKEEERLEIFKSNLNKLIEKGMEGSFVIFNENSNDEQISKFVQFAGSREEEEFILDIPLQVLTKEEENRLLDLKEFSSDDVARDYATHELISYQKYFNKNEINNAAELAEKVFRKVFKFLSNYEISTELNLEK